MNIEALRKFLRESGIDFIDYRDDPKIPPRIRSEIAGSNYSSVGSVTDLGAAENIFKVYDEIPDNQLDRGRRRQTLEEIENTVNESGTDALAWYVSYHFDKVAWGIYVPFSSLEYLRAKLYKRSRRDQEELWSLCFNMLCAHEIHHFFIDYRVGCFEGFLQSSIWKSAREELRTSAQSYLAIEEAGAEANLLRHIRRYGKLESRRWSNYVAGGLPGYRDGIFYVQDSRFDHAIQETLKAYLSVLVPTRGLNLSHPLVDFSSMGAKYNAPLVDCPVYLIQDEKDVACQPVGLSRLDRIPFIEESRAFKKAYDKLHPSIQEKWQIVKHGLLEKIPGPPKFKKCRGMKDIFEVRVTPRTHRVLLSPSQLRDKWMALNIGTHKELGTG